MAIMDCLLLLQCEFQFKGYIQKDCLIHLRTILFSYVYKKCYNVVSADGSALSTTAFKAYLSVPAEAASSGLDKAPAYGFELGEGDATGIDGLPIDGMKDASLPVYDLSGRRTTAPGKGIIIRGDKKYLVK